MTLSTRRRFLLGGLGLAAAGGLTAWLQKGRILGWIVRQHRNESLRLTPAPPVDGAVCALTPEQVEGPFFIAAPHRSDIREDREGKEMRLRLQVVRMPGCEPVAGAIVEIWHCDADGVYSGYPEEIPHDLWKTLRLIGVRAEHVEPLNARRFLRGAQLTDADGRVAFTTIFPGWYEPRAPHVHLKLVADDRTLLTSQFYFPQELCDRVHLGGAPYAAHGACPYTPENDPAIEEHQDASGLLLSPAWSDHGPLEASARIGILQQSGPGDRSSHFG